MAKHTSHRLLVTAGAAAELPLSPSAVESEIVVQIMSADVGGLDQAAMLAGTGNFVAVIPLPLKAEEGSVPSMVASDAASTYVVEGAHALGLRSFGMQGLRYLFCFFPQVVLQAIALESGYDFTGELSAASPVCIADDTFCRLAATLDAVFGQGQEETSQLLIDCITRAVAAHLVTLFGHKRDGQTAKRGGLAPWQKKRALEMLEANLHGDIPLRDIAAQCRLSERHFSRAFGQSMGMPPQRWLMKRRVETAKVLLRDAELSLSEVAKRSGFADQSYLTRVFSEWVGTAPGAWRRSNMGAPNGEA